METKINSSLTEQLHRCAVIWTDTHGAAPTRIGRVVVNDGGLVQRIAQPGASVTTATLEKFAAFLGDPGNWPEGSVPQEALDLAHRVGVTAKEAQDHVV
ncbi:hypothetical protein J3454_14260 [Erythrobacter sp. NFXS35]|uniref:hypothetical protein n=1 Tax=Erythrobacter sp. NFXS35 TaxID=2818436 RepID=UPI0032DE7AEA